MDYKLIYLARRNPTIAPEDWPRTWRSHAVFAAQFPVIGAQISSLFYCSRVREPTPSGAAFRPPGTTEDYDGAAIVAGPSPNGFGAGEITPKDRAKIDQDELRVFSTFTPNFALHGKETLVEGGKQGDAAVIRFLARKAGTSPENFISHLGHGHAAIGTSAAKAGSVTRYVQNEVTRPPPPGYEFDAITEMWFANVDAAVQSFADGAVAALGADMPMFCDTGRTVTILTTVIHRWPRAR